MLAIAASPTLLVCMYVCILIAQLMRSIPRKSETSSICSFSHPKNHSRISNYHSVRNVTVSSMFSFLCMTRHFCDGRIQPTSPTRSLLFANLLRANKGPLTPLTHIQPPTDLVTLILSHFPHHTQPLLLSQRLTCSSTWKDG